MVIKESPLQGMRVGAVETVSIRELPGLPAVDLRVATGTATLVAVEEILGIKLPGKTGQTSEGNFDGAAAHALCLAPDWWLVVGLPDAVQRLAPLRMEDQHHFSVVDVSGQRTAIELEGTHAREVLAHLWEQDLRDRHFPIGAVSQGLMAKAPVIVWHIGPSSYRIFVRSSFALHLWKALVDAAEEWM